MENGLHFATPCPCGFIGLSMLHSKWKGIFYKMFYVQIFLTIKTKNFTGMEFNNLKLVKTNIYVESPIHLLTFPKKINLNT
jgi:hypothetical protein